MQYVPAYIFFSDDICPKDDVDKLFDKLEPIEPSSALIAHILQNILSKSTPLPPSDTAPTEANAWNKLDGLVVRNEKLGPC